MIELIPSPGIERQTNIDFKLLSSILTNVLETAHKKRINIKAKVHKSKEAGTSLCEYKDKWNYKISLDQDNVKKRYQWTALLHELRHCIQFNLYGFWPNTVVFKSYKQYFTAAEEVDARKMEKMYSEIVKIYEYNVKAQAKFKKLGLNTIKGM
tara:strand:+ start:446 stop:904 length:459 start_codon:yes stop_codon:yes gene_type:complete